MIPRQAAQTLQRLNRGFPVLAITGPQQFGLRSRITQSLAGRVSLVHLLPFSHAEPCQTPAPPADLETALFKGAYPPL